MNGTTMHKKLLTMMTGILLTGASAWAAENDAAQRRTDWFKDAQWGVSTRYLVDMEKDKGMSAEEWNKRVDAFDVPGLAKQLEATGCRYYVITLGQNSGYFCSPNAAYDKYAGIQPSKCSKRDLVADISAALAPKGIKVMLYLPCQAPNADPVAQKAFGLPQGAKPQPIDEAFAKKWAEVIQEWSKRYGKNVVGWWFDGVHNVPPIHRSRDGKNVGGPDSIWWTESAWWFSNFNQAIARIYADAVRSGNPDSITTFSSGFVGVRKGTDAEDYTAGEIRDADWVECEGRWLDGKQWHMLSHLGPRWCDSPPRFSDEAVIEITRNIIKNEGVVTWDVPIQPNGLIPEPFVKQLTAVREGLTKPAAPIILVPPGNLAYRNKRAKLLDVTGTKELQDNGHGDHVAKNGVDGNATTIASAGGEWPWTYHVDLGVVHPLTRVVITFGKDRFATEYKVNLSADGQTWTTVAHVKDATGEKAEHTFAATSARYVRIQGLKPDGGNQKGRQMAVVELEVYADKER
jgi:hypothetical protein